MVDDELSQLYRELNRWLLCASIDTCIGTTWEACLDVYKETTLLPSRRYKPRASLWRNWILWLCGYVINLDLRYLEPVCVVPDTSRSYYVKAWFYYQCACYHLMTFSATILTSSIVVGVKTNLPPSVKPEVFVNQDDREWWPASVINSSGIEQQLRWCCLVSGLYFGWSDGWWPGRMFRTWLIDNERTELSHTGKNNSSRSDHIVNCDESGTRFRLIRTL